MAALPLVGARLALLLRLRLLLLGRDGITREA